MAELPFDIAVEIEAVVRVTPGTPSPSAAG
jgi:hypothetical protein